MDKMREEFETWWSETMNLQEMDLYFPSGYYLNHGTQRGWLVWQARQPEINVLKARVAELSESRTMMGKTFAVEHDLSILRENKTLKARVIELEHPNGTFNITDATGIIFDTGAEKGLFVGVGDFARGDILSAIYDDYLKSEEPTV